MTATTVIPWSELCALRHPSTQLLSLKCRLSTYCSAIKDEFALLEGNHTSKNPLEFCPKRNSTTSSVEYIDINTENTTRTTNVRKVVFSGGLVYLQQNLAAERHQ